MSGHGARDSKISLVLLLLDVIKWRKMEYQKSSLASCAPEVQKGKLRVNSV